MAWGVRSAGARPRPWSRRLDARSATPALRDLRRRPEVAATELSLVNQLDRIRQQRASLIDGRFDVRTPMRDYAAAFREAGLFEVGSDEATAADRIRHSAIARPIVAAFDDWAALTTTPGERQWLLDVARRAAPDPWGDRFRQLSVHRDRQALLALARDAQKNDGAKLDEMPPQVWVSLAIWLGEGADACSILLEAQRRHPGDFWLNLYVGRTLRHVKRHAEALGYLRAAVALRPDAAVARLRLADSLRDNKDLQAGIAELRRAIELDPALPIAHYNLAAMLRDTKDRTGAIEEYRRTLELDPTFPQAHMRLGSLLVESRDLTGAIAAFGQAAMLDPRSANAHVNLGLALHDAGDLDRALSEFHQALEIDPKNAPGHYNLGRSLFQKRLLDEAIIEFNRAIDLDPKLFRAHGLLGLAFLEQGRFAEARQSTLRARDLIPDDNALRRMQSAQLAKCEQLGALDALMPKYLSGEAHPAGAAEWLALAELCRTSRLQKHAAAARFYAGAFAADPILTVDPRGYHRYSAACSAVLAAAGAGNDAEDLPESARLDLRQQAHRWLRALLSQRSEVISRKRAEFPQDIQHLSAWLHDPQLDSVRSKGALAALAPLEQEQWNDLWSALRAVLAKVQ